MDLRGGRWGSRTLWWVLAGQPQRRHPGVGEAPMVSVEVSGGDGIILGVVGDVSLVTAISVIRFQGSQLGAHGRY